MAGEFSGNGVVDCRIVVVSSSSSDKKGRVVLFLVFENKFIRQNLSKPERSRGLEAWRERCFASYRALSLYQFP